MKCNQSCPGIELVSPCPYPVTITITPRAPPISMMINIIQCSSWAPFSCYNFDRNKLETPILEPPPPLYTLLQRPLPNPFFLSVYPSTRSPKWETSFWLQYSRRRYVSYISVSTCFYYFTCTSGRRIFELRSVFRLPCVRCGLSHAIS